MAREAVRVTFRRRGSAHPRIGRREGIFAGISSGAVLDAALGIGRKRSTRVRAPTSPLWWPMLAGSICLPAPLPLALTRPGQLSRGSCDARSDMSINCDQERCCHHAQSARKLPYSFVPDGFEVSSRCPRRSTKVDSHRLLCWCGHRTTGAPGVVS
jgi:hypothetical protein